MKHGTAAFLVCALMIASVLSGLGHSLATVPSSPSISESIDVRSSQGTGALVVGVPDDAAPVTTPTLSGVYHNGWFSSEVGVNLTAVDQTSGVNMIEYSLQDGIWLTYTGNFTISTEGYHTLLFSATDMVGNKEPEQSINVNIDRTVPVTSYSLDGMHTEGTSIFVGTVGIVLTSQDVVDGVTSIQYSLDGGNFDWYTGPFTVEAAGSHYLRFNSTDLAGNWEAVRTINFSIDNDSPSTMVTLHGNEGLAGWFIGNVTVNITASDTVSGTDKIVISVDGGQWMDYAGNFTVNGQGNHTLRYLAIDKAGNNETERSRSIKIDIMAPVTMITLDGTGDRGNLDFNGSVTVSLIPMDEVSGKASTKYSLDGGVWTIYATGLLVSSPGNHSITFNSADRAGNVELSRTVNFTIDLTAPTSRLSISGSMGSGGWYNSTIFATWNPADDISGVMATHYRLDSGDWATSASTLAISAEGMHRLEYYSVDNAGNAEDVKTFQFKLDSGMPAATISLKDGMAVDSSHLTVTVNSLDNGSGISSMTYSVDGNGYTSCMGGKIIMTGLNEGQHTLLVRTTDQAGNVAVQKLDFTVNTSGGMNPLLGLILVIMMIAAILGLIVVWRRSKRKG